MTEREFTDEEVIKALVRCTECPLYERYGCDTELKQLSLNLINRQKAENEEKSNKLRKILTIVAELKAEAIKEFAERLKEAKANSTMDSRICTTEMIDNLVKEMTEGKEC